MFLNPKSMKPITNAKIREATNTRTALLCNSANFGQVTLFLISSIDSTMYALIFSISFSFSSFLSQHFALGSLSAFARVERLELPANGFGDRYSTN